MAYNGSGTFNRTNGTNTGSTLWESDRDDGTKILSSRHDTHDQDLADGLTNAICKDGQQTVTANIPFAGFQLTNIGNATARANATNAGQIQDGGLIWGGTAGGSANTITCTLTPTITAYVTGMRISFIAANDNTGGTTLNVNGVSATGVRKFDPNGQAFISLTGGEITTGQVVEVTYNGTYWCLINPSDFLWQSWTPTYGAGGSMTFTSVTTNYAKFFQAGNTVAFVIRANGTTGGSADKTLTFTLPITAASSSGFGGGASARDGGTFYGGFWIPSSSTVAIVRRYDQANWATAANTGFVVQGIYEAS